ncbi:hypothetical protein PSTG_17659 [Puccinia striiformis f. sp. tritici PST-78]|uniref:Uncharacterized protein n=1 Tax=Puccinia striiformis f. sp. tritici PST-78 TaxID=1165861 RepID=A0A0L0UPJ8_9BASI|nr:hypothetical protein PSTG_17659 [Puccinia striiformis f. sp. tritici PST-78]
MKCYLILYLYPLFFWTHQAFIDTKPAFTPGAEFHVELPDLNLPPEDGPSNPLSEHFASGEGSILPNNQMQMHSTVPALNSFPIKRDSTSTRKRKGVYADTELRMNAGLAHGKMHKSFVIDENQITLESNTLEAAQSRQIDKHPIGSLRLCESNVQKEDVVEPMTNTERLKLCNFRDWSFFKDNSVIEINRDPQRQESNFKIGKLLGFLNKLKQKKMGKRKTILEQKHLGYTLDTRKHFWIHREYAEAFFKAYRKERGTVPFPAAGVIKPCEKYAGIYKIALDIVDEKIDLEKYAVFSKDIVNHLTSKLNARLSKILQSQAKVDHRPQVTSRIEVVKRITKCAVFLNLAYLTFFKELENGKTTVQQIESFLTFIKDIWEDIEKGETSICNNNTFGETLHKLLSFESSKHKSGPSHVMGIAWNIVELWVQKAANFQPHISLDYHPQRVEIINKIIFYSNYDKFPRKIPAEAEAGAIEILNHHQGLPVGASWT